MADEPIPLDPAEIEPRGTFPDHTDHPHPPLSAEAARAQARQRLEEWRAEHGSVL